MPYNFYPQSATGLNYIEYPAGPTAAGLTVTAGNGAEGSYAEVVASSPWAANWLTVMIGSVPFVNRRYQIDVATGAAGSETVRIPNLPMDGSTAGTRYTSHVVLPVAIPTSTRIAVRAQGSSGTDAFTIRIGLIAAGDIVGVSGAWTAYGTGGTNLVSVDPGGTANTKGSYSEITSSTSTVSQALALYASSRGNTGPAAATWLVDWATGAAGSETVLIPDMGFVATADVGALNPKWRFHPTYIASSTRVAARASCTSIDATDRLIGIGFAAAVAPSEPSSGGGTVAYASFG